MTQATINAVSLGNVQSERQGKESSLFQFAMPAKDSNKAILLDLLGVLRTVSIDGTITGTEAELQAFILSIETLQSGSQGNGYTFQSSLAPDTINVFINTFSWTYVKGSVNMIDYSLSLVQGSATSQA